MRQQLALIVCSAVFGLATLSSPVIAQQKTAKECREEWRANKAANQANGVTEKAYVAQCRSGGAPSTTTTAAPVAVPESKAAGDGSKTAKECRDEWRANKAANQANGVTEKAYVAQCRGGTASPTTTTVAPSVPPVAVPEPNAAGGGPKTAKECREEWRSNKAANQANGVTEKAYVAQCRSGSPPPTTTTAAPPQQRTAAPEQAPAEAKQKTATECREEWRANKAANQANGVTEKAYVAECRSGSAPAQTTTAPTEQANPPAPPAPAPAPTAEAPPSRPPPSPSTNATTAGSPEEPTAANEFSTEAQAKMRCPTDTVVWANLTSKVYHFSGTRSYGNTKRGAYMCERDTAAAGMRAAKNETHP
jgi:hypothetical protein